jgi:hypothetical protein
VRGLETVVGGVLKGRGRGRERERKREANSRTSLLNNVRNFSFLGLFSLPCQLPCVVLRFWSAVEGRCFMLDLIPSQNVWGGRRWGRKMNP